jgi:hypothetical protein
MATLKESRLTLPVVVLYSSTGKMSRILYTRCWNWYLILFIVDLIRKPILCTLYLTPLMLTIHVFSN